MTADTGLLNGIETEFESCSFSLNAGVDGCTCNFVFLGGLHLKPRKNDKIEIYLDGFNFKGIVDDVSTSYEGKSKKYSISVVGPQQNLDQQISISHTGTAQEILETGLDGTAFAGSVIGDTELATFTLPYTGDVRGFLETMQTASGGFIAYLDPLGAVYLINRTGGHTPHPHKWIPSNPGYQLTSCKYVAGLPKTQFRCTGKNAKPDGGGPDSEVVEYKEAGDGTKVEFGYDDTWTEITQVDIDGDQVGLLEKGSTGWEDADAYHDFEAHKVVFKVAPGDGLEVLISGIKHFSDETLTDEALAAELAAKFGGNGLHPVSESHPEFRTQGDSEKYATGMRTRYGGLKMEASATVWAQVDIYTPRHTVEIDDGDGFAATLAVQSNQGTRENGKWIQNVTAGNGREGSSAPTGAGSFNAVVSRIKRATTPSQPPAPTTTTEYTPPGPPWFSNVRSIGFDTAGNCFIADTGNQRIRKVSTGGILSTIAGNGSAGNSGDGGAASAATLDLGWTGNQVFKSDGTSKLYMSGSNDTIRMIDLGSGMISRFAGTGTEGNSGDGGPATSAEITNPMIVSGIAGLVYFQATTTVSALKKVDSGTIDTFVEGEGEARDCQLVGTDLFVVENGSGEFVVYDSGGARTVLATLPTFSCYGCATDGSNWYVSDPTVSKIYKLDAVFAVTDFAGTTAGYSGDGGPAIDAQLNGPHGMAVFDGFLYVADENNYCIRRINLTTEEITLFAGTPETSGFSGDGGPAT